MAFELKDHYQMYLVLLAQAATGNVEDFNDNVHRIAAEVPQTPEGTLEGLATVAAAASDGRAGVARGFFEFQQKWEELRNLSFVPPAGVLAQLAAAGGKALPENGGLFGR